MPDTSSILAPLLVAGADGRGSALILFPRTEALPAVGRARRRPRRTRATRRRCWPRPGPVPCCPNTAKAGSGGPGWPATGWAPAGPAGGRGPGLVAAVPAGLGDRRGRRARIDAADPDAGLGLVTEVEAVPGGVIRARHTLTNRGPGPYVVDQLEVVFPLPSGSGRCSTSPGGRPPSASRSGTGSATDCGCGKAGAGTPATTRPRWSSPGCRASDSAPVRPTACTWPGAATPCTGSSGSRPAWAWPRPTPCPGNDATGDHHHRRR